MGGGEGGSLERTAGGWGITWMVWWGGMRGGKGARLCVY